MVVGGGSWAQELLRGRGLDETLPLDQPKEEPEEAQEEAVIDHFISL